MPGGPHVRFRNLHRCRRALRTHVRRGRRMPSRILLSRSGELWGVGPTALQPPVLWFPRLRTGVVGAGVLVAGQLNGWLLLAGRRARSRSAWGGAPRQRLSGSERLSLRGVQFRYLRRRLLRRLVLRRRTGLSRRVARCCRARDVRLRCSRRSGFERIVRHRRRLRIWQVCACRRHPQHLCQPVLQFDGVCGVPGGHGVATGRV